MIRKIDEIKDKIANHHIQIKRKVTEKIYKYIDIGFFIRSCVLVIFCYILFIIFYISLIFYFIFKLYFILYFIFNVFYIFNIFYILYIDIY